jgi:hypothetical protein
MMTETSFPFASSSIATEDQWSSMMRMAQVDGVFATDPSGTDLLVTGSNASTVAVAAGEAWVQGTYYANSASLNVPVPTNSGGGAARKDLIVLRRDPAGDVVSVKYKTGSTSGQDTGWKAITLASGYATQSAACGYRVKDGLVTLRGNFKKTSGNLPVGAVTKVATLPIEARPAASRFGVVAMEWNAASDSGTAVDFLAARAEIVPRPVTPSWCGLDSFTYSL